MNCRKYRACLVGVLAIALICGALLYLKYGREGETPVDGVLVNGILLGSGNCRHEMQRVRTLYLKIDQDTT